MIGCAKRKITVLLDDNFQLMLPDNYNRYCVRRLGQNGLDNNDNDKLESSELAERVVARKRGEISAQHMFCLVFTAAYAYVFQLLPCGGEAALRMFAEVIY